ncbi:MAG: metal-dependent hydrolase [Acidimicrobiaceae bacterium]|nr:metal-dependent hydrolase [Acidimicrobiaceae bacterium]
MDFRPSVGGFRTCVSLAYLSAMMERSHAAMGLTVGAGIGLAAFGVDSSTWLIPAIAVCGAAILPDIDEPNSSVSREFGLMSRGFSTLVNKLAGGHCKLTHSILGLAIVMVLLGLSALGREESAILFGLLAASAWRIVLPRIFGLKRLFVLVGAGGGWYFYHSHLIGDPWLIALVGVGWLVHLLGDYLTAGGIPLLYPREHMASCPIFGATGSGLETVFATVLYAGVGVGLALWYSHHSQITAIHSFLTQWR